MPNITRQLQSTKKYCDLDVPLQSSITDKIDKNDERQTL